MTLGVTRELTRSLFRERIKLNRARLKPETRRRKPTVRTSRNWRYPFKVERAYSAYVSDIMQDLSDIAMPIITDRLDSWLDETGIFDGEIFDAYEDEFSDLLDDLRAQQDEIFVRQKDQTMREISGFGLATNAANAAEWDRTTTLAIGSGFNPDTGWVEGTLKNWSGLNYTLIKSLGDEYIKKVNTIVAEGVQSGTRYTDIMTDLRKMDTNMTKTRAKLIARDQIGKLNGTLTEGRQRDAGVEEYIWVTSIDEDVRDSHRVLNGSTNKWSDNTIYKPKGTDKYIKRPSDTQGAIPGSQVQCRCTAVPSFDDLVKDIDELIEAEEVANPELRPRPRRVRGISGVSAIPKARPKPKSKPKKDVRNKYPQSKSFKNNAEAEEAIKKLGPRSASFGRADVSFAESMHTALARVPSDVDLSALASVGNYGALRTNFKVNNTGGYRGMYVSHASDLKLQGVFLNTSKSVGADLATSHADMTKTNNTALDRFGHRWFMSDDINAIAHHEVGHAIRANKHGAGSVKNEEMKRSWSKAVNKHWGLPRVGDYPISVEGRKAYSDAMRANKRGEYSRVDDSEAWAEAWSAYVIPSERDRLPKGIINWIRKEIDN